MVRDISEGQLERPSQHSADLVFIRDELLEFETQLHEEAFDEQDLTVGVKREALKVKFVELVHLWVEEIVGLVQSCDEDEPVLESIGLQ